MASTVSDFLSFSLSPLPISSLLSPPLFLLLFCFSSLPSFSPFFLSMSFSPLSLYFPFPFFLRSCILNKLMGWGRKIKLQMNELAGLGGPQAKKLGSTPGPGELPCADSFIGMHFFLSFSFVILPSPHQSSIFGETSS